MPISASVGNGGVNKKNDVVTVQEYLCVARRQDVLPPIGVDGIIGPKTIGAITLFQQTHTGFVDGRVDPNGQAIAALESPFADLLRGQIRSDGLSVLDASQAELAAFGLQLPADLSTIFDDVRRDVVALGGGPDPPRPATEVANLTAAAPAGVLLGVAIPAAGAAAGAAAEAALITLAALIALLVIIMVMPHMSRLAEEVARQIQVLMNKVLNSVQEYVRQIEDLLIRNPDARERCFEKIARFNFLTAELIALLTTPRNPDPIAQQQHIFRTTNKFKEWQQALLDLFNCLDSA